MPNDSDEPDEPVDPDDLFSEDLVGEVGVDRSTSVEEEKDEFLSIFKGMAGGILLVWILGALVSLITTAVLLYFAFAILQHYGVLVALPLLL